ncbi:carnitine 3-dehydrogenase [Roseibacterium sp. SDUM158017]|uniref:carnitine 3-dehydrogenase n=1 Tax=Roseicyclus salinarum TaxID=3036773 RepID=UPI002414D71C|nr:carnitine 3-dehydrogenase [Roseibacterium sp. SDUM158017]MDG4647185.1 carnitine 3-dehydrogenase [Roseibacterium sp. SDUM158017]
MKAAIVGGGVIGGGWAARFLLNGWDVSVFDPDPEARRKVQEVLANARRALPGLYARAMPPEGRLSFHTDADEAVADADWVQESVPERLDLKHRVFAGLLAAAPGHAVIGSSTSGFRPSQLNLAGGRVIVAHPFNPVYLLPLVELVGDAAETARAADILRGIGMFPLVVRKEIDAHIADRLLEAVWREALWLVKDGIATTGEIDEAIRMGFGLRWAQMGLFETYRIAGGEAGMRHFLEQFGPCLTWPWTKLMDVPDFDDDLVELIAGQSDAQSGHATIRELERRRDDNLVAMMRALKRTGSGAGGVIAAHESASPAAGRGPDGLPVTAGMQVAASDADHHGRMDDAACIDLAARATDRLMELIETDAGDAAPGLGHVAAESRIRRFAAIAIGDRVTVTTEALGGDGREVRLMHRLWTEGEGPAATVEVLIRHVDLATLRAVAPGAALVGRVAAMVAAHAGRPERK